MESPAPFEVPTGRRCLGRGSGRRLMRGGRLLHQSHHELDVRRRREPHLDPVRTLAAQLDARVCLERPASTHHAQRPRGKLAVVPTVRPALAGDLASVVELWQTSAGPTRLPSSVEAAHQLLHHDAGALLVIEDGGEIVGTLIVGWDGWRCHLYRMAVRPDARRKGVASALVRAACVRATQLGARRLDAMVDDDNVEGRAFWEAAGFELDLHDRRWSLIV
jgi:ribosomal protein S18 acetylase RimI-like enzyme